MKKKISDLYLHRTGYWTVRVDGKEHYFKPKGCSKEDAELQLAKLRIELSVSKDGPIDPNDIKISDMFDLHLDKCRNTMSAKNWNDKARILNRFGFAIGDHTFQSIPPAVIEDFVQSTYCRSSGAGKRQVDAHLRCAFKWCRTRHRVTVDPMIGLPRPPANKRRTGVRIHTR